MTRMFEGRGMEFALRFVRTLRAVRELALRPASAAAASATAAASTAFLLRRRGVLSVAGLRRNCRNGLRRLLRVGRVIAVIGPRFGFEGTRLMRASVMEFVARLKTTSGIMVSCGSPKKR